MKNNAGLKGTTPPEEKRDRLDDVMTAGEMGDLLILALDGLSQKAGGKDTPLTPEDFVPVHGFAVHLANQIEHLEAKAYGRDTTPEAPQPHQAA